MRYAILSEIHANPKALKKVLRDAHGEKADKKSWLGTLPYVKMYPGFACAHGSVERPEQFEYIMDARSVVMAIMHLVGLKRRVLFVGHTHHACVFDYDSAANRLKVLPPDEFTVKPRHLYIVNVGSVGYPRNDHQTTYVLYDTDTKSIRFRNLKFDFASYIKDMQDRNVELPLWLDDFATS